MSCRTHGRGFSVLRATIFCLPVLLIGAASAFADEPATTAETPPAPPAVMERVITPRSQQFTLKSRDGREYRIQVAEPKDAPPKSGYPVIYALDGNAVFATFAEAARVQRRGTPILVVAVGYPSDEPFDSDRTYDFTPERRPQNADSDSKEKVGGQHAFLAFIQDELKPLIEKKFKVNRDRQTLFGHSLGGLFVLHVLYTHPEAFQFFAAGSPSIWWNDQSILGEEREFIEKKGAKVDTFLFVGDRDAKHMVHDATRLADRLGPLGGHGLRLYFHVFEGEDHVSVLPAAISRAYRIAADGGSR